MLEKGKLMKAINEQSADVIEGGFSDDVKFLVTIGDERYLVRRSDKSVLLRKEQEFKMLRRLESLGVEAPKAYELHVDGRHVYLVLSYLEGEDGTRFLPKIAKNRQYALGQDAGRWLAQLHRATLSDDHPDWSSVIESKWRRYLERYDSCGVTFSGEEEVRTFIEANLDILAGRQTVLQHDDFHPSNMIFSGETFVGAIDFERYDFGDPLFEFTKVSLFTVETSIPFAQGQISSYLEWRDEPEFFRFYSLYTAMMLHMCVPWAVEATPTLVDEMVARVERIVDEHDHFRSYKPSWWQED
ncbi:phosphotransferase family protein [Exiguobacterium flavidum]|uniref:phosphotransferase family protein n=1 Tax=Exiguobacterium flavidum TaxID=2184695 RepID=UPI000DF8396C|nr:aminoglycoside phosphotransferase family protein [Exiguobacterium flavidum]